MSYIGTMFLRWKYRHKDGKPHYYWELVESYRTECGPRQRVVAHLGAMDDPAMRGAILRAAGGHVPLQESLFDEPFPEWVEVNVRKTHVERPRRFGDVWLALELLKKLGLGELFDHLLSESTTEEASPGRPPKIPWARLAEVLVIARFCEPSSELHIAESFYQKSALADLLGISDDDMYVSRLYRALDQLLLHKDEIQHHIKERFGELFAITYDILLYDVTSTYFEGEEASNPQAKRGYSRDSRPDCKQVCIGLVVTKEGIPIGYEVFAGNRHDSKTVKAVVEKIEALYGKADRVWIMDRGMASKENLELLAEEHRRYIIGTSKSQLKKFEAELLKQDWKQVHEGLEVKLCASPEGSDETFILCRSAARQHKEQAMHDRFIARMEKGLTAITTSCAKGRPKDPVALGRRIGRLLQSNSRAAALFEITVEEQGGRLTVNWKRLTMYSEWVRLSEGCYLLRTNIHDWTPEDLWKAYINLTDAEAAFRVHKQDLELRPIWHQREDRVQAHILVCFLGYVLWKCFGQIAKRAGLGGEPRKIIEEIKTLTLVDVVLQTRTQLEIRLRCVTKPEPPLALLLDRLKMSPPERLEMKLKTM
jgi:transposase